jgi:hypothetical protein
VQGGFFLGKKPLNGINLVFINSGNAIVFRDSSQPNQKPYRNEENPS